MSRVLESDRLRLDPFEEADRDELWALFVDPEVRRYLLDDTIVPPEWVDAEIAASRARFDRDGCGLWAIRRREGAAIMGFVGFRPFFDPPELQLLYGLLPEAWGEGVATEAARTVLDHAFGVLGLEEVRAATDAPNQASISVLERLGMEAWSGEVEAPPGTLFYRLRGT